MMEILEKSLKRTRGFKDSYNKDVFLYLTKFPDLIHVAHLSSTNQPTVYTL